MSEWQPIETAPKDGTSILVYSEKGDKGAFLPGGMAVDRWQREYTTGFGEFNPYHWPPTHWMPLPEPPL